GGGGEAAAPVDGIEYGERLQGQRHVQKFRTIQPKLSAFIIATATLLLLDRRRPLAAPGSSGDLNDRLPQGIRTRPRAARVARFVPQLIVRALLHYCAMRLR